jgi:1,6-anhydro-N-acetylmuramate kinase
MAALAHALAAAPRPVAVRRFDDVFWDGEAKEAVAFALLGYLHERRRPGTCRAPRARAGRACSARSRRPDGRRRPALPLRTPPPAS